jgi:hypothetical protein
LTQLQYISIPFPDFHKRLNDLVFEDGFSPWKINPTTFIATRTPPLRPPLPLHQTMMKIKSTTISCKSSGEWLNLRTMMMKKRMDKVLRSLLLHPRWEHEEALTAAPIA